MGSSIKDLLAKSGVISVTGSPVPYGISYIILTFFNDMNIHDASLLLTILYTLVNTGRIFLVEYIFDRRGISLDASITTLIKRLRKK